MEDKITVRLTEDVRPYMAGFIIHKQADVKTIERAFQEGNYEVVGEIAHRMQGTSAMFGIAVLADVCASLINSVRARDAREIGGKIAELSRILGRLDITYE